MAARQSRLLLTESRRSPITDRDQSRLSSQLALTGLMRGADGYSMEPRQKTKRSRRPARYGDPVRGNQLPDLTGARHPCESYSIVTNPQFGG